MDLTNLDARFAAASGILAWGKATGSDMRDPACVDTYFNLREAWWNHPARLLEQGIVNKDDVWWHEAPLPPKRHNCETWTSGPGVRRCACGGYYMVGFRGWTRVNSRRRSESESEPKASAKRSWWKFWTWFRKSGVTPSSVAPHPG